MCSVARAAEDILEITTLCVVVIRLFTTESQRHREIHCNGSLASFGFYSSKFSPCLGDSVVKKDVIPTAGRGFGFPQFDVT
jgi:hypothetical protein